jgi:glycosyltransferase involved in cell wall biosynthesis
LRIILANKFLYPRGGDCLYTLRLMELLSRAGHEVIPFGMMHPLNIKTKYDDYFVSYIDFNEQLGKRNLTSIKNVLSRSIINLEATRAMERLIKDTQPDIVHLQNIHHQLTPSIIEPAWKNGIPVIWTLHDYILNCPNDNFYCNGHVCAKCLKGGYYNAMINRCKKGSFGASLLAAAESYYNSPSRMEKKIAKFVCPSKFMAKILVESGIAQTKVQDIPNFLPQIETKNKGEDYFLYFGRLAEEKGGSVLIEAFNNFGKGKLIIAGDGHWRKNLKEMCNRFRITNVDFLGHQSQEKIHELLAGCKAVIVPSTWWENFPYSVMEAMAFGKPVVGSAIGGIPEMIAHEANGLLFASGSSIELTERLSYIWDNPEKARLMGKAGQMKVRNEYSPEKHYERIMQVYREAISSSPTMKKFDDVEPHSNKSKKSMATIRG